MVKTLIKHGSEAGYRAELITDSVCDRCRNGHRVFDRQYSAAGKKRGVKYGRNDVIDHLYKPGKPSQTQRLSRDNPETTQTRPEPHSPETAQDSPETGPRHQADPSQVASEQPLRERLGALLADRVSGLRLPGSESPYVEETEVPDYLQDAARETPKDEVRDEEYPRTDVNDTYVFTTADIKLMEENMGTYLSVVGMTLEIVDPYCGPILGDNLENMVKRWTKVVSRYPKAANLFLSKGGGVIMDWIGALQATWPVLYAGYEHHLARTVQTDGRRVYRVVPGSPNGSGNVDATMPPMPEQYDYTVR